MGRNSTIVDPILSIFELFQDFMHLVICKFHEDPTKNEEATLFTNIFP